MTQKITEDLDFCLRLCLIALRKKIQPHCKGLQGTTGTLQGNQTTGIFDLQGYTMHVIACNFRCPSTGIRREKW